jgi:hypothetical protein
MLGKDLEKERTFVNPQKTTKKTEDSSVFLQSFFFSIKNNFHANSFRILVEEGATDLLDRKNCLRKYVPGHEGLVKVVPLNVASAADRKCRKSPQKSTRKHFSA